MSPSVSILIPLYNAKDLLEDTLRRLTEVLNSQGLDYEILCLDDGSLDETKILLEQLSAQYPKLRFFISSVNKGLGSVLRALSEEARGDVLIYCDVDLPFGESVVPILLGHLNNCDIAVASRYNGISNNVPPARWLASRFYYFLCRILFRIYVRDIGSGSVAIKKEVFKNLDLVSDGFGIHVELYAKAVRQGLFVKEIPFRAYSSVRGTFRIARHAFPVIRETFRLWWLLTLR